MTQVHVIQEQEPKDSIELGWSLVCRTQRVAEQTEGEKKGINHIR